jgi:hypothetical protein
MTAGPNPGVVVQGPAVAPTMTGSAVKVPTKVPTSGPLHSPVQGWGAALCLSSPRIRIGTRPGTLTLLAFSYPPARILPPRIFRQTVIAS